MSIVRKDGVYYNLNLEVIEKPSFEETILTFFESVLYYEYMEKAETVETVSNKVFDEDNFFDDSPNDIPDTPF